ncbi:MAG: mandelate racemase/muconate lactonizing enzyme family protein [Dehalococcoidales bacterium]|nr:mandelate racemase/muconate lactonizing enzyme family protein [Dehalococcoidales bacterium]
MISGRGDIKNPLPFSLYIAMTELKIKDAKVYHLSVPLETVVKTSFGSMDSRHAVILELIDEYGNTGIGESWVNYPKWAAWERQAAFEQVIIPCLKGRTFNDIPAFMAEMARDLRGPSVQSRTLGPLIQALCGVELALWDLAAKVQGLPLCQLLFDNPAKNVPVYASGLCSPLQWDLIDLHLDLGVKVFKLKIGFGDEDIRNLKALTDYFGDSARLAVDANRAWTFDEAAEWLKILREFNILWLEEPLKPEEEYRMGNLADLGMVPLAGGENIWIEPGRDNPQECAGLPLDIFQPDITKNFSLSGSLELLKAVHQKGKKLYPHFFASAPGQAACLHLAAGCGDVLQEMDISLNPLRTDLFTTPVTIKDGMVTLPDNPGLGWEPDYEKVNALRVP